MRTVMGAILAAAMLIAGPGAVAQARTTSAAAQIHVRSWGRPGPAWGGPRAGWGGPGPRVWWGGRFGWGWGPRPWWGPGWYAYPAFPYAYTPPAVVVQPGPQTFIQQPPPPAGQPEAPTYWYYCAESRSYYPHVGECPGGWMTVVPPSSSP